MTKPSDTLLLGFEVGSAEPVQIPLGHLCVTGQTQASGKTTTLEALIRRSGRRAVAFVTKRGEGSFTGTGTGIKTIPPYFRERADWVFVASLIDATLGEKNKILRPWLMKVCRNTKTLAEVHRNVKEALPKARGFAEGIYTEIDGYLDLVVPQLRTLKPAPSVDLRPGLNVMDLTAYSTELQGLVIRSVLEWVYEREEKVITVIPEAWEFIPQSRGSPVTLSAEELIRKGGNLENYLFLDSQDISNVNARIRKSVHVWVLGVQREENEIKRTVGYVKASGVAAPKPSDIATLETGQFYACFGRDSIKTYVWPAWMKEADARQIARGARSVESVAKPAAARQPRRDYSMDETLHLGPDGRPWPGVPDFAGEPRRAGKSEATRKEKSVTEAEARDLRMENKRLRDGLAAMHSELVDLKRQIGLPPPAMEKAEPSSRAAWNGDAETLYQRFKARLTDEAPTILTLLAQRPELRIEVERHTVEADAKTILGRTARLLHEGDFDEGATFSQTHAALKRTGPDVNNKTLSQALKKLVAFGFLTDETNGYRAVQGMKVNVVDKKGDRS